MGRKGASELIERVVELERIDDALAAALRGSPSLTVLEGSAGLGKTSLLDEARERGARRDFAVLVARGSELEQGFSFGVVRQLFEPLVRGGPASEMQRLLQGAGRAASLLGPCSQPDPEPPADLTMATMHGVFWVCVNAVETRPALLIVDDAQWADPTSLQWVHFLKQRWDGMPIALLVASRPRESMDVALTQLTAEGPVWRRTLQPLSSDGVAALVRDRLGDAATEALCRRFNDATAGNPFYLRELIREVRDRGWVRPDSSPDVLQAPPVRVARSIALRLHRLGCEATSLARAIAVLGGPSDVHIAAAVADLASDAARAAADRLIAHDILAEQTQLTFVHAIVQAAVYAELSPAQRMHGHWRAAQALTHARGDSERAAAHLLQTEPRGDASTVEVLREAARVATERGSPAGAAAYLRRALDERGRDAINAGLLHELGRSELISQDAAAIGHLRQAAVLADPGAEYLAICSDLLLALSGADRGQEAVEVLDAALTQRHNAGDELSLRLEAQLLGYGYLFQSGRSLYASAVARAHGQAIPDTPAGRQVRAALVGHGVLHGELTAAAAAEALDDGLLLGAVLSAPHIFHFAASGLRYSGRFHNYVEWMDRSIEEARERGSILGYRLGSSMRSQGLFRQGRLRAAEADARTVLESRVRSGWAQVGAAILVEALVERGQTDDAQDVLDQFQGAKPYATATLLDGLWIAYASGRLRFARGDVEGALSAFLAAGDVGVRCGVADPTLLPWRNDAAACLVALERRCEAAELARKQVSLTRRIGARWANGMALRTLGLVLGGPEGTAALENAVRLLENSEARLELARALADLGAAKRREGTRTEARRLLARAREIAHECGATVLEERARTELLVSGARPRRIATTGWDALTASELRVAETAARGLANSEVARALFVSPKTVETHLMHIYSKCNIHSRRELIEAVQRGSGL